jgi:hypothetical protein
MRARVQMHQQRRRHIRAKIAAQRVILEQQLEVLRIPAMVFDKVRAAAVVIHDNGPLIAMAGSVVMFLMRRRLVSSVTGSVKLARKVMRALTLWKMATSFLRRHPGNSRWNGSAAA